MIYYTNVENRRSETAAGFVYRQLSFLCYISESLWNSLLRCARVVIVSEQSCLMKLQNHDGDRRMSKKSRDVSIVRSSTAEYLTYIAATGGSDESIEFVMKMRTSGSLRRWWRHYMGLMFVQSMIISEKSMEIQNCPRRQLSENSG